MDFSIHILGSNSALPFRDRYPSSQYVQIGKYAFLLDCGEGCQLRLQKYNLSPSSINTIFITHLHGDHIFGLPGLLTSMSLNQRKKDLHIIAPRGIEKFIDTVFKITQSELTYEIIISEVDTTVSSVVASFPHIEVKTVPLNHRIPTNGYIIKEKDLKRNIRKDVLKQRDIPYKYLNTLKDGEDVKLPDGSLIRSDELTYPKPPERKYAYLTDTSYMPELSDSIKGVNLMYHDATFMHELKDKADRTKHTTAKEAAILAKKSGVGKLLLGHFSSRYDDLSLLLNEAREIFPSTELAIDGTEFNIPKPPLDTL